MKKQQKARMNGDKSLIGCEFWLAKGTRYYLNKKNCDNSGILPIDRYNGLVFAKLLSQA